MTEEERRRRIRKKRRMARLRARRRKLITLMILSVLLLLTVIVGISSCAINNAQEKARIEEEEKQKKKAAEAAEAARIEAEKNRDKRPEEFAVDPENLPGSTEQTEEKVVYLTFDDGPSVLTQQVLDILDQYDAKATFFVTNHAPEYAHMIKVAHDKGHTIGMHTSSHDYQRIYASTEAYFADLDAICQTVKAQIGYIPCFIRFPGGSSNTVSSFTPGIMTELTQEVQKRGFQYYDWNATNGDGAVRTTNELIAKGTSVLDNNLVYLAHDSATKQTTVESLGAIIEFYKSQGYVFKALDRQTITAHHGVSN